MKILSFILFGITCTYHYFVTGVIKMNKLKTILPEYVVNAINNLNSWEFNNLTEIRLRVNKPVYLIISNIEYGVQEKGISKFDGIVFTKDDAKVMWRKLCQGAPYSFVQQQREGYITVEGNRVGFCGTYAVNEDNIKHIEQISSFCIRIKHQVKGCANRVFRYLFENNDFENTLFVAPPGAGKTTMLRDIARLLSCEGYNVCIADERNEISASSEGVATLDIGKRTDVIADIKKSVAIDNMIRALTPDVILCDELGSQQDINAIQKALKKGVKVVASVHGNSVEDINEYKRIFNRFVFLSKRAGVCTVDGIYNGEFEKVIKNIC